ncbi:Uncharacterised protein [Klebsiella pneumoniae]|nr:Uncharacterised protein [Klebsiella pneumoniae]
MLSTALKIGQCQRASQHQPFNNVHRVIRHREHHQPVGEHAEDHRPHQRPQGVRFTGARQRKADPGRRHRVHQIAAAGVDLRRADARGQQNAAQPGQQRGNHVCCDFVTRDPQAGEPRRLRVAADGVHPPSVGSERQRQLGDQRHHQHDNDDGRHLPQRAKGRRDSPLRHLAARQNHVFGNRPTVAVGHCHALNHKQAGQGGEHVRNAQHHDQKGVKQPHQGAEREGYQNRFGGPQAMPDKQGNHQRVSQRCRRSDGQIEAADGEGNRHPNGNHRDNRDRAQNVDDVERVKEVVRGEAKDRHQQHHGQQHAPLIEKIKKSLTARYRRVYCQGLAHAAAPPVE